MIRYYPSNQGGSAYPALIAPTGTVGGSAALAPNSEFEFFPLDLIITPASGGVEPYVYTLRRSADRGDGPGGASLVLNCTDLVDPMGTAVAIDIVVTDDVGQVAYTEISITLSDPGGYCGL